MKILITENQLQIINERHRKFIILYLHGLGSSIIEDKTNMLKGAIIMKPELDYKNPNLFDVLYKLSENKNIQAVMGHSMGGYLAYYLSVAFDIPCLLFNPAFNDVDNKMYNIPKGIKNKVYDGGNQYAIVGKLDDVVPAKKQISFLKKTGCKILMVDIGHDIPSTIKKKAFNNFLLKLN